MRATVPAWPLIRHVRASGVDMPQCATLKRAYHRAKERGHLEVHAADRLAVEWLGIHPSEVWADWFELAEVAS